jgi:hypothetical protein
VDGLSEPEQADANVFRNKLQLDDEYKELVEWSVQAHERGKEMRGGKQLSLQDFAPDKGKGLIIMLYGKAIRSRAIRSSNINNNHRLPWRWQDTHSRECGPHGG